MIDSSAMARDIANEVKRQMPQGGSLEAENIIKTVSEKIRKNNEDLLSKIDDKLDNLQITAGVSGGSKTGKIKLEYPPLPKTLPRIPKNIEQLLEDSPTEKIEASIERINKKLNQHAPFQEQLLTAAALPPQHQLVKDLMEERNYLIKQNPQIKHIDLEQKIDKALTELNNLGSKLNLPTIDRYNYEQFTFPKYVKNEEWDIANGKLLERRKELLKHYTTELERRKGVNNKFEEVREITDYDIDRMRAALDDFSYSPKNIINFRAPIFLSDCTNLTTVNFAATQQQTLSDQQPKQPWSTKKKIAVGAAGVAGIAGLGGLGYLTYKHFTKPKVAPIIATPHTVESSTKLANSVKQLSPAKVKPAEPKINRIKTLFKKFLRRK